MSVFEASAPAARIRKTPPVSVRLRAVVRPTLEAAQAIVVFALLAWLIYRGAAGMDYHWQWYRVQPFFYKVVDGELIWGPLVRGLIVTLQIAGISMVLSVAFGLLTAALRMSGSIAGRTLAVVYLEAIRNTPLLVQLFLFYFVIAPIFGVDRFWAGVLCLSFFEGSFASEIIRGGIQAVERGQFEAAEAVGLTRLDKYLYIVVPQALPLILPPLTGLLISLIKHSAIVSVIAVSELTTQGLNIISDTFMAFEVWFLVAGMYLALTVSLSLAVGAFEMRLKRHR
jgi:polar amino acid transport system permease protein